MTTRVTFRLLFLATLLVAGGSAIRGQTLPPPPHPSGSSDGQSGQSNSSRSEKPDSSHDFESDPEIEMKARLAIKAEQKEYDDNLVRAREAAELGTQISEAYGAHQTLDAEEAKKLERLEKLARKIRSEAGGLGLEEEYKDPPSTLESAVKRVKELATELEKDVEKTPKHVVSTAVIDRANDLLGVIQRLRKLSHR
jgi:hypothetical protein